jgi:thymidylate kinase
MFVVADGPNGSGKTTLVNRLSEKGYSTLSSPNGTPLAKMLRPVCRGTEPWEDVDPTIQFMSFSAARLDEYIRCVKDRDEVIVADRWWTSTYVYQCILQGFSIDFMQYTIHPEEKLDLVLIMTGDPYDLIGRVEAERAKNPDHKKCAWTQEHETMIRIGEIYLQKLPHYLTVRKIPFRIINTSGKTIDEVQVGVEAAIAVKTKTPC